MPSDMLIKIDTIKGETKQEGYTDYIEIENWSWGAHQAANLGTGTTGGGRAKANLTELNFSKQVDQATPGIGLALVKGTHIPTVKLVARKAGGDSKTYEYFTIELKQVLIASQQFGGQGEGGYMTENVTLAFADVTIIYNIQNNEGGASKFGGWTYNVQTGVAATA